MPMTDRLIVRYAALAQRLEALLEDPALQSPGSPQHADAGAREHADEPAEEAFDTSSIPGDAELPQEITQLLTDAVYRLGLYASAMPGARPLASQELLDALERELARIG